MGRFSTTVHIKNNVDRMRLVNTFCDIMKKRGFVPCKEDEAAVSYLLAFGEGWVTLANEDYKDDPRRSSEDMREMSAALNTSAFSVEVVDSDFAIMTLRAPNGTQDQVVVGDGSGYDVPEMEGDRKLWELLLSDGKTWEQFSEAAAAREVFVEDALGKVAAVLGIDPFYIDADHDEVLAKADGKNNITVFYFKKAQGKAMSLNTAFVKVFGEVLEPLGFKKIKYKYPYFVRIVGGEIIYIITYMKMKGHPFVNGYERADCSQYEIVCKIETVYSTEINLPIEHLERDSRFLSKREIYGREHLTDRDKDYWKKVVNYFPYKPGDEKLTINGLENAVDLTKQILLPALDDVTDLKSFLEHIYQFYGIPFLKYNPGHYEDLNIYDGLVRIKVDTCESFLKRDEEHMLRDFDQADKHNKQTLAKNPERLAFFLERVDRERKEYISKHEERVEFAKHMFDDKEWCEKALEELERRKAANTELLRSYGLDI